MIRSRFSLLGVLVAAIGLMAVFASAAQAETNAKWLVLKADKGLVTGHELELETFAVASLENNTGSLLSEIGTTKISILCTGLSFEDALLSSTGGVKTGAKVKFSGCKFLAEGTEGLTKEFTKCVPKTNGGTPGFVETLPAHALLQLHSGSHTILILPDVGTEATKLELGASCAFGEELPIFGNLSLQDCGGSTKALEHLLSHLASEFAALTTLAMFAPRGQAGAKNAKIDGSAFVKLTSDRSWSGDLG